MSETPATQPLTAEEEALYREGLATAPTYPAAGSAVEALTAMWADRCRRLLATLDRDRAARDALSVERLAELRELLLDAIHGDPDLRVSLIYQAIDRVAALAASPSLADLVERLWTEGGGAPSIIPVDASTKAAFDRLAASPSRAERLDWPTLANVIREVDGNHDLGAGELAERILSHPKVLAACDALSVERLAEAMGRLDAPLDWDRENPEDRIDAFIAEVRALAASPSRAEGLPQDYQCGWCGNVFHTHNCPDALVANPALAASPSRAGEDSE